MSLRPLASRLAGYLPARRGFRSSAVLLKKVSGPPGLTLSVVARSNEGDTVRQQMQLLTRPARAFEKVMMETRLVHEDAAFALKFAAASTRAALEERHEAERRRILAEPDGVSDEDWAALFEANTLKLKRYHGALAKKKTVLDWFVEYETLETRTHDELREVPDKHGVRGQQWVEDLRRAPNVTSARGVLRAALVADLVPVRDAALGQERERRLLLVTGKFFASPAPTGRAKCRLCSEKIAKRALRVTEHYILSNANAGGGFMHARQGHFHAVCYCTRPPQEWRQRADVTWPKDLVHCAGARAETGEDLTPLVDALRADNESAMRDKAWQKQQLCPVYLSYPAGTITFDEELALGDYGQDYSAELKYTGPGTLELRTAPKNPKDK